MRVISFRVVRLVDKEVASKGQIGKKESLVWEALFTSVPCIRFSLEPFRGFLSYLKQ